jgi:YggT family protein
MILIFIRIMLTWFSGVPSGRPVELLRSITDPYLDWFRRFRGLRVASMDLSPILALGILSVVNNIFVTLGRYGAITLGFILALVLSALWSAVSFFLGFFIIVLGLRLIAYLTNRNVYRSFWRIIDAMSQPVLFRIRQLIFRNRIINYQTGLVVSISALLALRIGLGFVIRLALGFLQRLPF